MARTATVYAKELSRTPMLQNVVRSRYPIEELLHPYWKTKPDAWTITKFAALRAVVGGQPESMDVTDAGSRPTEVTNTASTSNNDARNDNTYSRTDEIASFVSYAHCNAISTQMHRVASTLEPLDLLELDKFLGMGLAALNAGVSPFNPCVSFASAPTELLNVSPTSPVHMSEAQYATRTQGKIDRGAGRKASTSTYRDATATIAQVDRNRINHHPR